MKTSLFVAGIVVIGISMATILYTLIGFQDCAPILDHIGSFPSTDISKKCEVGYSVSMFGGPLFVIGLGMMIGATQLWRIKK